MAGTVKISKKQLFKMLSHTDYVGVSRRIDVSIDEFRKVCNEHNIRYSDTHAIRKEVIEKDEILEFKCNWKRRRSVDSALGNKANAICVLQILEDYSDANKSLTVTEIIKYMAENYRQTIDRKTLYSTIELLQDLCYDIKVGKTAGNKNTYALIEQTLEPYEAKILLDSLHLNPLVPSNFENNISRKLINCLTHKSDSVIYYNNLSLPCEKFYTKETLFSTLDFIDQAFGEGCMMTFNYHKIRTDSQDVVERKTVSPCLIILKDYTYYLFCHNTDTDKYEKYRIDRISDVNILEDKPAKDIDLYGDLFYIWDEDDFVDPDSPKATETEEFVFRCDNKLLDSITEKLTKYIEMSEIITNDDGKTFDFKITVDYTYHVFFNTEQLIDYATANADKCEVIKPAKMRNEVIKRLKNNKYGV